MTLFVGGIIACAAFVGIWKESGKDVSSTTATVILFAVLLFGIFIMFL
jgi:hypothetical protein